MKTCAFVTAVFVVFDHGGDQQCEARGTARPSKGRVPADFNSYGCFDAFRHGWPGHISRVVTVVSRLLPVGLIMA
jgi:hypothetical protein